MISCVKPSANRETEVGGCGPARGRSARLLNLMKETLTVRECLRAALERGERQLMEHVQLMERGTVEDLWTDEVRRGALVRWDMLKRRALEPVREPSRAQLMMTAERLREAGQIQQWGKETV